MTEEPVTSRSIQPFDRSSFLSGETIMRIGDGEIGGKAHGLVRARDIVRASFPDGVCGDVRVNIPAFVVLATDIFDRFMAQNRLYDLDVADMPDDRIANAFQRADLPIDILGDLRAFVDSVQQPIAVRSSSRLEDALERPFAGVYETKMTPNNQPDPSERFAKLVQAIKFVFASTFFKTARDYIRVTGEDPREERMAVVLQEVVGRRFHNRFYPELSGVGRSYNYYPSRRSSPEDGVINLALGLGKTIVDGGLSWPYSPSRPKVPPPFASVDDLLENTQTSFWAINMGKPPAFDPTRETEYLLECNLNDAEYDATLTHLASTYVVSSDRVVPGVGPKGPRILNFAPLLRFDDFSFNETVSRVLVACREHYEEAVEIEFGMTFSGLHRREPARLGLVQVRPMTVPEHDVDVTDQEMRGARAIVSSERVLGNGVVDTIQDIVYVRPKSFDARFTPVIAREIEELNTRLFSRQIPFLLIGFGRWGSSDPWLGIPVKWGQICGAKAIVESSLVQMNVEPSQGSHFFHNLSSFRVCYFTVSHRSSYQINWEWLDAQQAEDDGEFVRHVRVPEPLIVKVDGRTGRGVILSPPRDSTNAAR